jgi:hypothetical protein
MNRIGCSLYICNSIDIKRIKKFVDKSIKANLKNVDKSLKYVIVSNK